MTVLSAARTGLISLAPREMGQFDIAVIGNPPASQHLLNFLSRGFLQSQSAFRGIAWVGSLPTGINPSFADQDSRFRLNGQFLSIGHYYHLLKENQQAIDLQLGNRLSQISPHEALTVKTTHTNRKQWTVTTDKASFETPHLILAQEEPSLCAAQIKTAQAKIADFADLPEYNIYQLDDFLHGKQDLKQLENKGLIVIYGHDHRAVWMYDYLRSISIQPVLISHTGQPWHLILGREPLPEESSSLQYNRIVEVSLRPDKRLHLKMIRDSQSKETPACLISAISLNPSLVTQVENQNTLYIPAHDKGMVLGFETAPLIRDTTSHYPRCTLFGASAARQIRTAPFVYSTPRVQSEQANMLDPHALPKSISRLFSQPSYAPDLTAGSSDSKTDQPERLPALTWGK